MINKSVIILIKKKKEKQKLPESVKTGYITGQRINSFKSIIEFILYKLSLK